MARGAHSDGIKQQAHVRILNQLAAAWQGLAVLGWKTPPCRCRADAATRCALRGTPDARVMCITSTVTGEGVSGEGKASLLK